MLRTLESYIGSSTSASGLSQSLSSRFRNDRRFTRIAIASIAAHLIFYTLLIKLAVWTVEQRPLHRSPGSTLVKIAEVAPPADRAPLRPPIQNRDRVDVSRLQYDPEHSNDINLVERSRKHGDPHGSAQSSSAPKPPATKSSLPPLPPPISVQSGRTSQISASLPTQLSPADLPPPPSQNAQNTKGVSTDSARDVPQRTGPLASASGTRELGLDEVKAQYRAHVRQKIWQINERNKPKDWIRDTLSQRATVGFLLTIARSGDIVSLNMTRPSGYSVLDRAAREAILLARPFDGFPPTAGDAITFDVEVKYEPIYR